MYKDKNLTVLQEYFANTNINLDKKNQSIRSVIDYISKSNKLVFLLQDDTILNIKVHRENNELDISQLAIEDFKLYDKYNKKIRTVVICGSSVSKIKEEVYIGQDVYYKIDTIYLRENDGDNIYNKLQNKIIKKQILDDNDKVNLILLPLMKLEHNSKDLISLVLDIVKKIDNYEIRELYSEAIKIIYNDLIK